MDVGLCGQGFREGGYGPGLRLTQQAIQHRFNPLPAFQVGWKAGRLRMHGRQALVGKTVQQCAHGGLAAVEVGRQPRDFQAAGGEQKGLHP